MTLRRIEWSAAIACAALLWVWPATAQSCPGDCNGDGEVSINELIIGVNIALGAQAISACAAMDSNGDGAVTVNELIRAARRPSASGGRIACDAAQVVRDRAAFWQPLAEDQDRFMAIEIETDWLPVGVPAEDLAACVDILLENVFAHTPEGVALGVRLARRAAGGGWLTVADDGPGFDNADLVSRGSSAGGSTGLGLDIARRIAEASGGSLTIGRSPRGGAAITLALGPTAAPEETARRPGRNGRSKHWRHARPADARLSTELAEWSAIVGHDVNA